MTNLMCIEYLGSLGDEVRVPALKGASRFDGGRIVDGGGDVKAGECRLVDQVLGQQLVDQGNYRARTFLLAVDSAVADGKSKVQVLVCARDASGRPKSNVPGKAATKETPAVPAVDLAIALRAPGSAHISPAKQLEPGLFVAMLTAPREPGPVEVRGTVDGEEVFAVFDFPAPPEAPATPAPPVQE